MFGAETLPTLACHWSFRRNQPKGPQSEFSVNTVRSIVRGNCFPVIRGQIHHWCATSGFWKGFFFFLSHMDSKSTSLSKGFLHFWKDHRHRWEGLLASHCSRKIIFVLFISFDRPTIRRSSHPFIHHFFVWPSTHSLIFCWGKAN